MAKNKNQTDSIFKSHQNNQLSNSNDTFYQELASLLITKTVDEIKQHELWWNKFQQLDIRKREAIKNWSESKVNYL